MKQKQVIGGRRWVIGLAVLASLIACPLASHAGQNFYCNSGVASDNCLITLKSITTEAVPVVTSIWTSESMTEVALATGAIYYKHYGSNLDHMLDYVWLCVCGSNTWPGGTFVRQEGRQQVATGTLATQTSIDGVPAAVLDEVVSGTITLRKASRIWLSVLAGKSTFTGGTASYFDVIDTNKIRLTATIAPGGGRTATTLDGD